MMVAVLAMGTHFNRIRFGARWRRDVFCVGMTAEKGNESEEANEEQEVEKNVLQDMFVVSFGDPGHIVTFR
jgi:hypothetical protein